MDKDNQHEKSQISYQYEQKSPMVVRETAVKYEVTKTYNYSDLLTWPEDERWELIEGIPYAMSAPNRRHQEILGKLHLEFGNFLKGKTCKVYVAPFDVRLKVEGKGKDTVVQPDISVICDKNKLDDKGCKGAPDLAIEILSPSNSRHDLILKKRHYQIAGVKEYWIIDPERHMVQVYLLNESGQYVTDSYADTEEIQVTILPELIINLQEIFEQ